MKHSTLGHTHLQTVLCIMEWENAPYTHPLQLLPLLSQSLRQSARLTPYLLSCLQGLLELHLQERPVRHSYCCPLLEATRSILGGLTPREAKVLRMRFGIDMNTDHTLEEVGKQFDVTRERIRQIEAKALRKLRHPSRSELLRSFLDAE